MLKKIIIFCFSIFFNQDLSAMNNDNYQLYSQLVRVIGEHIYSPSEVDLSRLENLLINYDINYLEPISGHSILIIAAEDVCLDFVQKMLELGADPNIAMNRGNTPLHFAAEKGHIGIAKILLDYGASWDKLTRDRPDPISPMLRAIFDEQHEWLLAMINTKSGQIYFNAHKDELCRLAKKYNKPWPIDI